MALTPRRPGRRVTLEQVREMHRGVAMLVARDPVYVPIFLRLERELARMEEEGDAVARARAIVAAAQNAMP